MSYYTIYNNNNITTLIILYIIILYIYKTRTNNEYLYTIYNITSTTNTIYNKNM